MTLVIETGLVPGGVVGANCYVGVSETDAWFVSLNDAEWAALTLADKTRHIILGAAYVSNEAMYTMSGARLYPATQSLPWPRTNVRYWATGLAIPDGTIPPEILRANMVAAGLSRQNLLPGYGAGGGFTPGNTEIKRERVDVLEIEYFHSSEGQESADSRTGVLGAAAIEAFGHPQITGLLAPLLGYDTLQYLGDLGATGSSPTPTAVPRLTAARRGVWYIPSTTAPSFVRGAFDHSPLAEDAAFRTRTGGD